MPHMKDKPKFPSVAADNESDAVSPEEDDMCMADGMQDSEALTPLHRFSTAIPLRKRYEYLLNERIRQTTSETASGVLMKYILEEEKKQKEKEAQEKDDVDLFFDTMKATVKKFSAANKILAKQRVFTVISELEGIDFSQQQNANQPKDTVCPFS